MFELTIKRPGKDAPRKLKRFNKRLKPNILKGLSIISLRAERQIKAVDLTRGGGFRITKTSTGSGRKRGPATPRWVKNTSRFPRIGDGTLRSSWRAHRAKMIGKQASSKITSNVIYARIIEKGGFTGRGHKTYLKGWPYVAPMLKRNRRRFTLIAGKQVFSGFKRGR